MQTLAGNVQTSGASDGVGNQALFNDPTGIAVAADGTLYVADNQNHAIRKISPGGSVSTFAGKSGVSGSADGDLAGARFDSPSGIVRTADGTLYVSDTGNHTIRCITPAGMVSTVAGQAGQADYVAGIGTAARFNSPLGVAVGPNGTLYIADSGNHLIRTIATDGAVSTLAGEPEVWGTSDGSGTAAHFNTPAGLVLDSHGNLFVTDANNYTVRKIAPDRDVTTFAGAAGIDGTADGPGGLARFGKPAEITIDHLDNLYVADALNHTIRKISPNGWVSTIAGSVKQDGSEDGANGVAKFFNPYGIAVSPRGDLWISDTYNETVRQLLAPFSVAANVNERGTLISWAAVIGRSYQVQFRDASALWQNLGSPVTASEIAVSVVDPTLGSQRFYRIERLALPPAAPQAATNPSPGPLQPDPHVPGADPKSREN